MLARPKPALAYPRTLGWLVAGTFPTGTEAILIAGLSRGCGSE